MRVLSINGFGYGLNCKKTEQPIETKSPTFKAKLVVANDAYCAVKSTKNKFERAVEHFRHKLALDTINPEDTVILRKLVGKAKEVYTGGVGNMSKNAGSATVSAWEKENLEIAINNSRTGFYYNDYRSEEAIGEDMYNAYKHVRYLEHYAGKN